MLEWLYSFPETGDVEYCGPHDNLLMREKVVRRSKARDVYSGSNSEQQCLRRRRRASLPVMEVPCHTHYRFVWFGTK